MNTCFRFTGSREDAEDLAQEVFVEVYDSIETFRGDAKLSTWIYRIALNKSLDFVRRRKREKRFAFVLSLGILDEEMDTHMAEADPHTELERKERIHVLNKAIDKLPENQRVAITLSKYEGLSTAEIAEIMQTSVAAVDALIHRAKSNLHKRLYNFYNKHL